MKSTLVSSYAVSQALRLSVAKAQSQLIQATKEATTGRVADVGLTLGTRTSRSVSFARDFERLKGIIDTNALAASRLSTTQDVLSDMSDTAQDLLSNLMSGLNSGTAAEMTLASAQDALQSFTSALNTTYSGEHIFAGINTDVEPINDFEAAASPNRAAFDAAFVAYFGFAQTAPAAASITTAQMQGFLSSAAFQNQFLGAGWQANWSNATDEGITSRIALNETVETSVSANESAVRKLMMATASVIATFDSNVSADARTAVLDKAVGLVGEAIAELGDLSGKIGLVENRVKNASERLDMQKDILELSIQDLEGVDPYEASTRVAAMEQQLETAYALTARIKGLSLLNYLK
jgi:flagellar hook-associated protein 3 FlgL